MSRGRDVTAPPCGCVGEGYVSTPVIKDTSYMEVKKVVMIPDPLVGGMMYNIGHLGIFSLGVVTPSMLETAMCDYV